MTFMRELEIVRTLFVFRSACDRDPEKHARIENTQHKHRSFEKLILAVLFVADVFTDRRPPYLAIFDRLRPAMKVHRLFPVVPAVKFFLGIIFHGLG